MLSLTEGGKKGCWLKSSVNNFLMTPFTRHSYMNKDFPFHFGTDLVFSGTV